MGLEDNVLCCVVLIGWLGYSNSRVLLWMLECRE